MNDTVLAFMIVLVAFLAGYAACAARRRIDPYEPHQWPLSPEARSGLNTGEYGLDRFRNEMLMAFLRLKQRKDTRGDPQEPRIVNLREGNYKRVERYFPDEAGVVIYGMAIVWGDRGK